MANDASAPGAARFEGRSVLVTGGGSGIGMAIAAGFAEEGARVAISGRDPERLKQAVTLLGRRGATVSPFRMDVRDRSSAESCADSVAAELGGIDVLVNNAGVSGQTPIASDFDEKLREIVETNLLGLFFVTRAALRHMKDGHGRIINIASVLAKFGVPGYTAYCAAKHGVIGFTKALALELAPRRITVNAICPGWVDTAMARQGIRETAAATGVTPEEFKKGAESRVPLGRFMEPAELAPLTLHIASAEAAMMTGQSINLDGGQAMW